MKAALQIVGTGPETSPPVSPEVHRLRVAALAVEQNLARRADIEAQIASVNTHAETAVATARAAAELRQQRQQMLEQQLRADGIDHAAPELTKIEARIAQAGVEESRAAAVRDAQQNILSDLQERRRALVAELPALRGALLAVQFDHAKVEIESDLVPALREAAECYGEAYAKLCGAGLASQELAKQLREQHGVNVSTFGTTYPQRVLNFSPVGFGFSDRGQYNLIEIDTSQGIAAAAAECLARWRSAR